MKHKETDTEVTAKFQTEWMLESNKVNLIDRLSEENHNLRQMLARLVDTLSDNLSKEELSYIIYGDDSKLA
jgi:hypothetical protein